jgi:hypothetical protein
MFQALHDYTLTTQSLPPFLPSLLCRGAVLALADPMGKEYLLHFRFERRGLLEDLLIRAPRFHGLAPRSGGLEVYEFRSPANTGTLPDAHVTIESEGLYFSDNGGEGLEVLQELVQDIARTFGPPRVEEL